MAAVDVTDILKACQSPDASQRQHGEARLKELESDASTFFQSLSSHLATPSNPVDTRKLSGACVSIDKCSTTSSIAVEQTALELGLPLSFHPPLSSFSYLYTDLCRTCLEKCIRFSRQC